MQEFSSISVSSYEAGSLADRLTEQAQDGWSVVAIVPTGSTVTAYLSRASDSRADAVPPASVAASAPMPDSHLEPATDDPATDEPAADAPIIPQLAVTESDDVRDPGDAAAVTDEPADAVSEAPGWAAGAGSTESTFDTGIGAQPETDTGTPETSAPAAETAAATSEAASDTTSIAAAAGAAPAGWYADPSSRFELRYWDGSQWTEHVSRAGQQYTDPPVA